MSRGDLNIGIIRSVLSVFFIFFIIQASFSQSTISGKVTNSKTKQALPEVNVYLIEQIRGTITNINGEFILEDVPNGKMKLQFSYMGYHTTIRTILSDNSDITINIELESTVLQTQEVVISSGTYSTQHENAIKIEVLKANQITAIGTPTFTQAMSAIPGVDMIAKGPGVAKPTIRGLSMTNIILLNNGVKMENYQFSENHPYIIDEFGIDRIEVIKGPASLLYGSDAVGGVINLIKEKPAPAGKIIGDYNIQYHSNTEGLVSNLGIRGSQGVFIWGIRTGIKSHSDYLDGKDDFVPNTRFNESSFKANIGLIKTFGTFKLSYDYNKPRLGMCVEKSISLIDERCRENEIWYQDLSSQIFSFRNKLFIKNHKLDVNMDYQMNDRKLQTDNTMPAFEMVDMDLNTLSYEIKNYFPSDENSEYIIGLQGMNKNNRNREAPEHVVPDSDVNDISLFALVQHTFIKKLKALAGVRYDSRSVSTKKETAKDAINRNFENISASFGATYNLNKQILFRGNIASAYRAPNIAELTQNGIHGVNYEQGDASLNAQRSYEADLSVHYHSEYLMFDIAGFLNIINDYIFLAPTEDTISSGDIIYRYSQTNAKLFGGEADLSVYPVDWFNFSASYSYVIGKQDDGSYLPFIPQNKLRLEIKAHKNNIGFFHQAFVKFGILYASKQFRPALFETETEGYVILNAGVGAEIKWSKQMLSIGIYVNNLFDKAYLDHLSTLKELGYQDMGRNICVSIKVPFGIR